METCWGINIHVCPAMAETLVPICGELMAHQFQILCSGSAKHGHAVRVCGIPVKVPVRTIGTTCVTSADLLSPPNVSSALKWVQAPGSVMPGTHAQLQLSFPGRQMSSKPVVKTSHVSCKGDRRGLRDRDILGILINAVAEKCSKSATSQVGGRKIERGERKLLTRGLLCCRCWACEGEWKALWASEEALEEWQVEKHEVWGGSDRLGTSWYIEVVTGCCRREWLPSHVSE